MPDELDVVLVANSEACCRPEDPEDDCLIVDTVCASGMDHVAGNVGAPVAPAAVTGYLVTNVDGVDQAIDRPFGGSVPVSHNPSDLVGIDFYALEHSVDGGVTFNPLPAGASGPFSRRWMLFPGPTTGNESFAPVTVGPYEVYETRRHFEDTHYGDWSPIGSRFWLGTNYNLLSPIDSTKLADGLHHFRVVAFVQTAADEFAKSDEPVLTCDGETEAGFVLRIDNRVISAIGHDVDHNCGAGVHTCTEEPDTHIEAVRVNGMAVGPCDTIMDRDGDVEIDFFAHDPDGHLDWFELTSHYGNSSVVDLLGAGATLVSLDGGPERQHLCRRSRRPGRRGDPAGLDRRTVPAHPAGGDGLPGAVLLPAAARGPQADHRVLRHRRAQRQRDDPGSGGLAMGCCGQNRAAWRATPAAPPATRWRTGVARCRTGRASPQSAGLRGGRRDGAPPVAPGGHRHRHRTGHRRALRGVGGGAGRRRRHP